MERACKPRQGGSSKAAFVASCLHVRCHGGTFFSSLILRLKRSAVVVELLDKASTVRAAMAHVQCSIPTRTNHHESDFANLDHAILAQVLSALTLTLQDKVRCEQVCTAWQALLDCSSLQLSAVLWRRTLLVSITSANQGGDISEEHGLILLSGRGQAAFSRQQLTFVTWLAKRIRGFSQLRLHYTGSATHRLYSIMSELYEQYLQAPLAAMLHMRVSTCKVIFCRKCQGIC